MSRDELVGTATSGTMLRRITFHDVVADRQFEFLTSLLESSVPPGVLAHLYRMRWNIEKSFDEVKNKLGEKKAWATSATAKSMQAQFICLSVNLLQLLEHELETQGIRNTPEVKRRAKRLEQATAVATKAGAVLPKPLRVVQQITQHCVKLIRWVAAQLWLNVPWQQACAVLTTLYAKL
ncbi:transposase [Prosthecobacter sp.]|uniref:transposase n=1 Tax=Prosthecobacter sp. TaxID=1965333 RepID=UPI00248A8383|nr:transposase [Prosthecobacter sp.]MDI1312558.1 transposase [Prosthecobacter sp.]